MKIFVNPYKAASESAKALREGLKAVGVEAKGIRKVNSKYQHDGDNHLVVNWGDSQCPNYDNMLNRPAAICAASNKLDTFKMLEHCKVSTVPFIKNKKDAIEFIESAPERVVYCRTKVQGSQGDGIVVATTAEELVDCNLYTGGLTGKRKEYRVHIFKNQILHVQQKKRRDGWRDNPDYSETVRNLKGGWVFTIQDVMVTPQTADTCIQAVAALGLDFGAVDILQTPNGKCWVLEVNTACGLEGTTVERYVNAIKEYLEPKKIRPVAEEGALW